MNHDSEIDSQMKTIRIFEGSSEFHKSGGWFEKLRRRHGLSRVVMAGESADADEKAEDFIFIILPGLIEGYATEDFYNADETGLFFKCLPNKAYGCSNEKCHGGNKSKDRLTVMVCCNMTDNDKVELLVIGKIQKSRCFKVFNGPIFRQQKSLDDLDTV
jgi:hypothetical protein